MAAVDLHGHSGSPQTNLRLSIRDLVILTAKDDAGGTAPYIHAMNQPINRVRVILLTQAIGPLDYRLPDGVHAEPGSVVIVPLGPRKLAGVVWDEGVFGDEPIDAKRLRAILRSC